MPSRRRHAGTISIIHSWLRHLLYIRINVMQDSAAAAAASKIKAIIVTISKCLSAATLPTPAYLHHEQVVQAPLPVVNLTPLLLQSQQNY
jgi:hypothetical protein